MDAELYRNYCEIQFFRVGGTQISRYSDFAIVGTRNYCKIVSTTRRKIAIFRGIWLLCSRPTQVIVWVVGVELFQPWWQQCQQILCSAVTADSHGRVIVHLAGGSSSLPPCVKTTEIFFYDEDWWERERERRWCLVGTITIRDTWCVLCNQNHRDKRRVALVVRR